VNSVDVSRQVAAFFRSHKAPLTAMTRRQSALLEMASVVAAVRHYEASGGVPTPACLQKGKYRLKTSSRGYPWNFSHFELQTVDESFEVHSNMAVKGADSLDDGCYVVDVAVVRAGSIPAKAEANWASVANDQLLTFVEAKKLVI
jgi:hypothetical protein